MPKVEEFLLNRIVTLLLLLLLEHEHIALAGAQGQQLWANTNCRRLPAVNLAGNGVWKGRTIF
jgi:hypothetical protein